MSTDFVLVSTRATLPESKEDQIKLILHGCVHDSLYRLFQSTALLPRNGDYSRFFTVSFHDLTSYLISHPDEFHTSLPGKSWDGMSVVWQAQKYIFREHDRGQIVHTDEVSGIAVAAARWLRWQLMNQGLHKLIPSS